MVGGLYAEFCGRIKPLSNGQSEGKIDKLKLVQRQMYSRGKFDLPQVHIDWVTRTA